MNGDLALPALSAGWALPVLPVLPVVLVMVGAVVVELLAVARRREARRRSRGFLPAGRAVRGPARRPGREQRRGRGRRTRAALARWAAPDRSVPVLAGLGAAALLGGSGGLLAGLLVAVAAFRWLPRVRSPAARRAALEEEWLVRQLPLTADLLAACLGSSSSPSDAAAAVAASVDPPMRDRLATTAGQLALGAAPDTSWDRLAADSPALAPLARCLVRTSLSGAPPAAALTGLAQAQRATASRAAHARVRRAGVLATAPLGVCFLPAFVLIGVAPVVMGLTETFAHRL